jgi:endonuclease/exonuclease/phosphatase family metal-dependent hydrolase
VKLLTFNTGFLEVGVGPIHIDLVPKIKVRSESLPQAIFELNPDIVCLQEVYKQSDAEMLKEQTKVYPYTYKSPGEHISKNAGLFIMSKYPFRVLEELDFRASGFEKIVAKGAVKIKITEGPYTDVVVVNVHFPYGGFGSDSQTKWSTIKKRNSNLEYLDRHVSSTSEKVVVVGDFNFGPDIAQENYEKMLSFGYSNISNGSITWDVKNPLNIMFPLSVSQSIDHIFLSNLFQKSLQKQSCRRVLDEPVETKKGPMYLSDHFGLMCDIELE